LLWIGDRGRQPLADRAGGRDCVGREDAVVDGLVPGRLRLTPRTDTSVPADLLMIVLFLDIPTGEYEDGPGDGLRPEVRSGVSGIFRVILERSNAGRRGTPSSPSGLYIKGKATTVSTSQGTYGGQQRLETLHF